MSLLRWIAQQSMHWHTHIAHGWRRVRAARRLRRWTAPYRLCLGCGDAPIPGWLNVDLSAPADLQLDLRGPLPFASGSAARIYSEHLLEHFELRDGLALLRECRRVLTADGVMRIAMPDLDHLVQCYQNDWRNQDWLGWPEHAFIDSRAHMLNVAMRGFAHRHLYDFLEVELRLRAAGFAHCRRLPIGSSQHADLRELETRADSMLVVEAWGIAAQLTKDEIP